MTLPAHRGAAALVAQLVEQGAAKASLRPWDAFEALFFDSLRRLLALEAERLVENIVRLGNENGAEDPTYWLNHRAAMQDELSHSLANIARLGATAGREALGAAPSISINWGLVNQQAVLEARAHAANMIAGVEQTTRQAVRDAVADWAKSGEPLSGLVDRIERMVDSSGNGVFSPARAHLIAQTESTNAFAAGNARAWEEAGVARNALKPAAHVGCRCYLQPLRLADGTTVMVWFTAVDERVCTQPIETPWGRVEGCKALHETIVSYGPLLGKHKP